MRSSERAGRRGGEELVDGLGGERVAVAVAHQRDGRALRNTVSPRSSQTITACGSVSSAAAEPDRVGARLGDGLGRAVGRPLDVDEDVLESRGSFGGDSAPSRECERCKPLAQPVTIRRAATTAVHREEGEDDGGRDDDVEHLQMKDCLHSLQHCRPPAPRFVPGPAWPGR